MKNHARNRRGEIIRVGIALYEQSIKQRSVREMSAMRYREHAYEVWQEKQTSL